MGGWRFVIALDDNRNILGACEIVSANFLGVRVFLLQ
jgi:hypothetical protein